MIGAHGAAIRCLVLGLIIQIPAASWNTPPYAKPEKFQERKLTLGSWHLPAVLTMPVGEGPFPAIVLVGGSGPVDEDETVGGIKVFKDLAWGLASNGIAVLRFQKRTFAYGAQMAQSSFTVMEESVLDARSAINLLSKTSGVDPKRIFILGHSMGGMLSPRIAAGSAAAGIIVLAGNTRPLEDLVVEQTRYLVSMGVRPPSAVDEALKNRAAIQSPNLRETDTVVFTGGEFAGAYWLDLRDHDPAAAASKLRIPMLFLRGERDYQVGAADMDGWKKALGNRKDVTFKSYPGLNHLFVWGSGPSLPQEYLMPGNVEASVITDIARWIKDPSVRLQN